MIRKLTVILLSGLICLLGVTSGLAQKSYELKKYQELTGKKLEFKEAPDLRIKVAAGELPSLEKRLPQEPLVVEPVEEIGQYGGVWRRAIKARDADIYYYFLRENLVFYSPDFTHIVPNLVKKWEIPEDGKSITFYLRKGMKWSDGAPFTADDFMFWWDDIIGNDELFPVKPGIFVRGGKLGKMQKIDNYTIKISFSEPYGMFLDTLASPGLQYTLYAPKHYLKQFHPKYTSIDKIKKEMKKEGFDTWINLFMSKNTRFDNPELPKIEAWLPLDRVTGPMQRWVRNPYYWKVDTEGDQLPYIDKIQVTFISSDEAALLKAMAGDIDLQWRYFYTVENYSVVMQNREKGDYRVIVLETNTASNMNTIFFNYYAEDPVMRKLFLDKRFRIALSVAINREEISGLVYKGLVEPCQVVPPKGAVGYDERLYKLYTEYDIEQANKLLDEIGLKWDKNHEYRLRSDGKRLRFVDSVRSGGFPPSIIEVNELIKGYWKKIGIELVVKAPDRRLWETRITGGTHYEIASCLVNLGSRYKHPIIVRRGIFPLSQYYFTEPLWGLWCATNGKSGKEPPAEVKRLREIYEEGVKTTSSEKRNELTREGYRIYVENLLAIGIVSRPKIHIFLVVKNNFRNLPPEPLCTDLYYYQPSTWFFKK